MAAYTGIAFILGFLVAFAVVLWLLHDSENLGFNLAAVVSGAALLWIIYMLMQLVFWEG